MSPSSDPAPPTARFALVPWLLAAVALAGCLLLGLLSFRLLNRAAVAEQNASIADAEIRAIEQELEIERLLAQRLAGEVVDLGQVRVATLSRADTAVAPVFAVIWSPASGDGVLIRTGAIDLPADARFRLTATRSPTSDRLEHDVVFDAAAILPFERGLFAYRTDRASQVTAFTLQISSEQNPAQTLRLGGGLHP